MNGLLIELNCLTKIKIIEEKRNTRLSLNLFPQSLFMDSFPMIYTSKIFFIYDSDVTKNFAKFGKRNIVIESN